MTRIAPNRHRRPRLPIVDGPKLRVAHLGASTAFEGVNLFPPERWKKLQAFAPNTLASPTAELQRLLERMDLRTIELTTVDHAIFVLTDLGDRALPEGLRSELWKRFGVPVYEIYSDDAGTLLAYECEAHDGWHVESGVRFTVQNGELHLLSSQGKAIRTGLARFLEAAPCPCGRAGLRITNPARQPIDEPQSMLAAIAHAY